MFFSTMLVWDREAQTQDIAECPGRATCVHTQHAMLNRTSKPQPLYVVVTPGTVRRKVGQRRRCYCGVACRRERRRGGDWGLVRATINAPWCPPKPSPKKISCLRRPQPSFARGQNGFSVDAKQSVMLHLLASGVEFHVHVHDNMAEGHAELLEKAQAGGGCCSASGSYGTQQTVAGDQVALEFAAARGVAAPVFARHMECEA